MARNEAQLIVRLPPDLKSWVTKLATDNLRSVNNEVVLALREKMGRMQTAAGESLATGPAAVRNAVGLASSGNING